MLSWNEIRDRATGFAREWIDETREIGEYQSFWDGFFQIFGVKRRTTSLYQKSVERLGGSHGFIDLFSPGKLIVEHKSKGQNLDSAFTQATEYATLLSEEERPRYIIVTDYARIRLYDLEREKDEPEFHEFPLAELPKRIRLFAFIAGYEVRKYKEEDPVNRKAVKVVVNLYRALAASNYPRESLEKLLVRLVFCFFADDAGVFEPDSFYYYLALGSSEDGSDFGTRLDSVFQTLNTDFDKRQTTLDERLATLPYVNGGLFAEFLPVAFLNREMRAAVLRACEFSWASVSPAIFGSMFQYVTDAHNADLRHDLGAHYTSEKNILKVIDGLFMDDLREGLKSAGKNPSKLEALWKKLGDISLLDPACGCGNFLVVAYRELRRLELEILKLLHPQLTKQTEGAGQVALSLDIRYLSKLSIERMYGIEIESFPALIARLSLWLTDHLANKELGDYFGMPFVKLPLTEQPHIIEGNALTLDWQTVVSKGKLSYIFGNPPFIGSRVMDDTQKADMLAVFGKMRELGFLDYVTAWYKKAADYIQDTQIKCAFVSTNSISQGEQVGILWETLHAENIRIHFAHRTFKWSNEAPGQAAVYCVIIGFAAFPAVHSRLFDYEDIKGEPHEVQAKEINPYLVPAPEHVLIRNRQEPISDVPEMSFGNMPRDGGAFILSEEERAHLLLGEPAAEKFIRPYIGAQEFLHSERRYCLWLAGAEPDELRSLPSVMRRVEDVKNFRANSVATSTRKMAETPTLFAQRTQPKSDYILVPRHSSENRRYLPMGFFSNEVIVADSCLAIGNATLYHFGVLESEMHMTWTRAVCGRLESRYRYSKDIVYNNFSWPEKPSAEVKKSVEDAAQAVLNARAAHLGATLADLYDPLSMPKDLLDAHHALDRAVDRAYGITKPFPSESVRLEFLFEKYQELTAN